MIKYEHISYTDGDTELEGFFAYSAQAKRPLVILCHAWRGRDEFICAKAESLAALGYASFALDMYGKGVLGNSKAENAALKKPFLEDRAFLQRRLLKGYDKACSLPYVDTERIVVIGFGFGGLCALDLARSGVNLSGAISIYGHYDPPRDCPIHPIKAKILLMQGYEDPITPIKEMETLQHELSIAKVDWQAHLFSHTLHAFANPSSNDPAAGLQYNAASANSSWKQAQQFLAELFT